MLKNMRFGTKVLGVGIVVLLLTGMVGYIGFDGLRGMGADINQVAVDNGLCNRSQ